ncbi:MAG: hypothetical protein AAGI25_18380 [Bacteroidota bacterium]
MSILITKYQEKRASQKLKVGFRGVLHSSAKDYSGIKGLIDVLLIE